VDGAEVLRELEGLARPGAVEGMARYGIRPVRPPLGVSVPDLRRLAKRLGTAHELAAALWATGVHEARILATMIEDADLLTPEQADAWAADLDSWDVCDHLTGNLVRRAAWAPAKAGEWAGREEEYVRRAGFSLMASLAGRTRGAPDATLIAFLALIREHASDERNTVKKAVNWALRSVGKRNAALNAAAIEAAEQIRASGGRGARWIAADALRELRGEAVQARLAAPARRRRT